MLDKTKTFLKEHKTTIKKGALIVGCSAVAIGVGTLIIKGETKEILEHIEKYRNYETLPFNHAWLKDNGFDVSGAKDVLILVGNDDTQHPMERLTKIFTNEELLKSGIDASKEFCNAKCITIMQGID